MTLLEAEVRISLAFPSGGSRRMDRAARPSSGGGQETAGSCDCNLKTSARLLRGLIASLIYLGQR